MPAQAERVVFVGVISTFRRHVLVDDVLVIGAGALEFVEGLQLGFDVVADDEGLLRFVGRDDEMIKSAGNRISPTEVEEAVTAGGETSEAVAVGVEDERLGQAIVVVAKGDGSAEAMLRDRLRRDLPNFMQPARYVWLSELPRNANGKLDRAALKGMTS